MQNKNNNPKPSPLLLKPDIEEAAKRWEAFYAGDIIDRPLVCVTARKPGYKNDPVDYYDMVYSDVDEVIDRMLDNMKGIYYGGEAIPWAYIGLGPDEIAACCGGSLQFSEGIRTTNWSTPVVKNWEAFLPIKLDQNSIAWQRLLTLYKKAAEKLAGKVLIGMPDMHTNMDLLMALRGTENLCMDLADDPEIIDEAMLSARKIFPQVWDILRDVGLMDKYGYCQVLFSMKGAVVTQCDFSCMISPAMFRRWVLPALEEEAAIAKRVIYHWDGPGALIHENDLIASKNMQILQYVPGEGNGSHLEHIELLRRLQDRGKSVHVWGTTEEVKEMHKVLRPEKTLYVAYAKDPGEADSLLEWFKKNT